MMLDLADAPQEKVIKFVKDWLKLLSEDRLEEACALLEPLPATSGDKNWTPALLKRIVVETFPPTSHFSSIHPEGPIFTDPYELEPQANREVVGEFNDNGGYWFDCDMPLNHKWSDLTALFEFRKTPNGYAVILEDLHVM